MSPILVQTECNMNATRIAVGIHLVHTLKWIQILYPTFCVPLYSLPWFVYSSSRKSYFILSGIFFGVRKVNQLFHPWADWDHHINQGWENRYFWQKWIFRSERWEKYLGNSGFWASKSLNRLSNRRSRCHVRTHQVGGLSSIS